MKHMRLDQLARFALVATALAVPALVTPSTATAQGFGLNEIGSCSVGRAGSGVAAPCADASRIYWNPAAAVRLPGVHLLVGAADVMVNGSFAQDSTGRTYPGDVPAEYPPHLFATYQVLPRFNVGVGVFVPYGLTSQWTEDFPGRFSALKASLASIYIQPNFAYDLVPGKFAVGGGPVIGISDVELTQGIDLSQQSPQPGVTFGQLGIASGTEFARATLKGQSVALGYDLGVHWQLAPALSVGARYLSKLQFDYNDATATFKQIQTGLTLAANNPLGLPGGTPLDAVVQPQFAAGGSLTERGVQTAISHPAQAQLGVALTPGNTSITADYVWVGWSAFKELPVNFLGTNAPPDRTLIEDYEDSWAVRGAIDHTLNNGWAVRVGASYVKTPVPDVSVTPLLPDMDRYNFAGGLSIPLFGNYSLDASYLRVETEGRRGRIVERTDRGQTAAQLNTGFYSLNANIVSVSLKAHF